MIRGKEMHKENMDAITNAITTILDDGHMAEIKVEKGSLLVVDVYSKRKVIYKQPIEETEAK